MDIKEAAILLGYVVAAMPNLQDKDLSATAIVWSNAMPDVSFRVGQQAILKILREKKNTDCTNARENLRKSKRNRKWLK